MIDPARHVDVTSVQAIQQQSLDKPELPVLTGEQITADVDHLTPNQARRAQRELNTRYRFPDGVRTLMEDIQRDGVTGKQTYWMSGESSRSYYLNLPSGRIRKVSKASYDALQIPDHTTDTDRAHHELMALQGRAEKARDDFDFEAERRLRSKLEAARARYKELDAAQEAERRRQYQLHIERQREEMARILDQHHIEL